MRQLLLATLLVPFFAASASAHDPYGHGCDACEAVDRSAEVALTESAFYRRLDHASRMRHLRDEIAFSETRLDMLRRLLSDYGRVNRFRTGSALTLSAERARLDLRREEILRRDLQDRLLIEQRAYREAKRHGAARARHVVVYETRRAALRTPAGDPTITIVNH